ncbi:MAG: hypothetical protein GTO51_06970 [Candidatus Latescibacteria bacterium]|nr:hypothetical protein [Candidatus Latescibacterota bacterium]NIM65713.1 hypothetical protein [Candidatus Latescibacterota bacterium]NIO77746.1 hypothetical protein [Candidatus Latescibacterota bacterium]
MAAILIFSASAILSAAGLIGGFIKSFGSAGMLSLLEPPPARADQRSTRAYSPPEPPPAHAEESIPRVFVLGIDGMDPKLLERFVAEGKMPNFAAFMNAHSYTPLGTSIPPQSPVAWSNFITAMDPGGHGIFDFIHRDPGRYMPKFSAASLEPPKRVWRIGGWEIPLSKGEALLLRRGKAFWQILDEHDIPYTIFKIPSNFPPADCEGMTLSGMGTPDLLGTYGTFSFYTDDPSFMSLEVSGGEIYNVAVVNGKITADLIGPDNTLKAGHPALMRAFTMYIDRENATAKLEMGGEKLILGEGEWSPWVPVSFDVVGALKRLHGICRFFLKSTSPYFQLYVTPINVDPSKPDLPICTPSDYSKRLYEKVGYYYTQGMPEDTKALEWGVFDERDFLSQTRFVLEERMRLLDALLEDFRDSEGLMFFYISTLDQATHVLWKDMDPEHPGYRETSICKDAIENLYVKMDSVLGVVQERIPPNTTLIIMSDHGFAPFYKKFNLNAWLYQNGYIRLRKPEEIGQHPLLTNVFWRRTRAYALGINGLYINRRGREGRGAVTTGREYKALLDELEQKLLAVRDPETGDPVIAHVYRSSEVYHGAAVETTPDLIIGYHRKYRSSDESALGELSKEIFSINTSQWSGDHCMAHDEVPGVLLVNKPLMVDDPDLKDLSVSILALYGIEKLPEMAGRVVFGP